MRGRPRSSFNYFVLRGCQSCCISRPCKDAQDRLLRKQDLPYTHLSLYELAHANIIVIIIRTDLLSGSWGATVGAQTDDKLMPSQVVDETDRMLRQSYQNWLPHLTAALGEQRLAGHERVVRVVVSATLTRDPVKVEHLGLHCPRYIAMTPQDNRQGPTILGHFHP